jgi:hypothetical protein
LRWRLFDFGRVDAEVKYATGANAEAILRYRNSVLRAAEDVEDSFNYLAQSELRGDEILVEIAALQRVGTARKRLMKRARLPYRRPGCRSATACGRDDLALTRNCGPSSGRLLQGPWRRLDTMTTGTRSEATKEPGKKGTGNQEC